MCMKTKYMYFQWILLKLFCLKVKKLDSEIPTALTSEPLFGREGLVHLFGEGHIYLSFLMSHTLSVIFIFLLYLPQSSLLYSTINYDISPLSFEGKTTGQWDFDGTDHWALLHIWPGHEEMDRTTHLVEATALCDHRQDLRVEFAQLVVDLVWELCHAASEGHSFTVSASHGFYDSNSSLTILSNVYVAIIKWVTGHHLFYHAYCTKQFPSSTAGLKW